MEAHGTDAGQGADALSVLDDTGLMVLFARGDAEAARLLTARLLPRALRHAARVLGDMAEAEDVAQEAMMRLWKAAPDWRADGPAQPATWLHKVVANLAVDRLRRARATGLDPDTAADAIPDTAPGAEARMAQADRMAALDAALATLPERQRQAVVLRHIEGLSNPEIAEVLEIGVEAVESLTARGKRALKRRLTDRRRPWAMADDNGRSRRTTARRLFAEARRSRPTTIWWRGFWPMRDKARAGRRGTPPAAGAAGRDVRSRPSWIAALGGWGGLGGVTAAGIVGLARGLLVARHGRRHQRRAALVAVGRRVQPGPRGTGTGERRCLTPERPEAHPGPPKSAPGAASRSRLRSRWRSTCLWWAWSGAPC
jgi:RNA polymerase sigma-70 factor (ECF subfamily)